MKNIVLLILISSVSFLYPQDSNNAENVIEKRWHDNGQLEFEGSYKHGKKHGTHKWWYPNGQLEFEENYQHGKKHGLFRGWWKNGKLDYEGSFKYNQRDGLWKGYYENGQLRKETDFLLQRKLSEQCFDEQGDSAECEENLDETWWWKDEKCFDEQGHEIPCHEYYLGFF